jgi:ketosteroid isomerase-like protein
MDMTSVFAPITKTVEQDDGSVLVYGKATDGGLDGDLQRCDPTWLAAAMPRWYQTGGNIREQHDSKRAIGKAIDHEVEGDSHYVTARIVDPVAVLKTKAGVFSGFSIGVARPKISKGVGAPNGVVDGGEIIELSLCDRPSNPGCLITLVKSATPGMEVKAADYDEDRGLVRCEELVEKTTDTAVDAKESDVPTLAETLAPESLEKLAAAAEPAELPNPAPEATVETLAVEKAADSASVESAPAGGDGGDTAPTFDVDAAKALVDSMLAKAEDDETVMDLTPVAPPSDEVVASVAISLIAGLIQSEAQGMVDNPGEDCDIKCLLNAVAALRWFIRRERSEGGAGGESDSSPYAYMAAEPDAEKTADAVSADLDTAGEALEATQKAVDAVDLTPSAADKAATPDATKTVTVDTDGDALVKALSAALEKADSPLRNAFDSMITKATETTAEAVTELTARLVKVESMAVPGGPALRRTEVERSQARRNDLRSEVLRYKALADNATDNDLRQGYTVKAAALEAEFKAL